MEVDKKPENQEIKFGGIIALDKRDFLNQVLNPKLKKEAHKKDYEYLIVIDGPNVGEKFGGNSGFKTEGIDIVIDYYEKRGHDVIVFIPQHFIERKKKKNVSLAEFFPKSDNPERLKELEKQKKLVITPSQDYDDLYCIEYARAHQPACIVSNDRYWDYLETKAENEGKRWTKKQMQEYKEKKKFIRTHLISFTFARDEFFPNPAFTFPDTNIN